MIPALLGITLCNASFGAVDFGQIHFLGSVLYSGCYIQATQQQYRPKEMRGLTFQNQINHFDLNFSYCRLIDNGKVLVEIALANPQHNEFQVFLKNAGRYRLVEKDLHQSILNQGLINSLPVGQSQLQIRTLLTQPYFDSNTNKTFDIELIYR